MELCFDRVKQPALNALDWRMHAIFHRVSQVLVRLHHRRRLDDRRVHGGQRTSDVVAASCEHRGLVASPDIRNTNLGIESLAQY